MDHLHFGARSRRKARRRQLMITAWLAGMVAAFFGVPGSNAAFSVLHLAGNSRGLSAGSIPARRAASSAIRPGTIEPPLQPQPARLRAKSAVAALKAKRHAHPKPAARPVPQSSPSPTASPSPTLALTPAPAGSVTSVIYSAAAEAGISGSYLLSVAECESALDTGAYNPGGYYGLFQFDQQTWGAYGYGSIYDPVAQSRTAARLLAAGQSSRWPNCA
jgi:soluble lytic murein transglycosylase-like protein